MPTEENKEKLKEWIFDEEKIVTVLSIAVDLKISLDDAKQLLDDFISDPKYEKTQFSITRLVSGELKDNKGHGFFLTKNEEDKNVFQSVNNEIIHSVCKKCDITSTSVFQVDFEAGKRIDEDGSFLGCPMSKNCIKRTFKTIPKAPETVPVKKEEETSKKQVNDEIKTEDSVKNPSKSSPKAKAKEAKPKPKSGNIASFFTQTISKTQPAKKSSPIKSGSSSKSEDVTETKSEDNEEETESEANVAEKQTNKVNNKKEEKPEVSTPKKKKVEEIEEKPAKSTDKKTSRVNSDKENKKRKSKKQSKASKKRKRIQQLCDSESSSSDIFDEEEDDKDEEMPEEREIETPPVKPVLQPTNKKRKVVDKTFVDEDGFIVTTAEYIYEEVPGEKTEQSEPVPAQPKKEVKEPTLKKTASNGTEKKAEKGKKGKKAVSGTQTTLTSFFKKQ